MGNFVAWGVVALARSSRHHDLAYKSKSIGWWIMNQPSPPSRKTLILKPKSPPEVSYGAGLGQVVSAEDGRQRLARYVTEIAGNKRGKGEGGAFED